MLKEGVKDMMVVMDYYDNVLKDDPSIVQQVKKRERYV